MQRSGLVSVTFRDLPPEVVAGIAAAARLQTIEWGADVHVPPGDARHARVVRDLTEGLGMRVAAYGSYFRCRPGEPFEPVLRSAVALGAPLIRVWAGERGSSQAEPAYRAMVAAVSRQIAAMAAREQIAVAYEFHRGTLTDTPASAVALLGEAEGMATLWQPQPWCSVVQQLAGLHMVLPWLTNVHAFAWRRRDTRRLALARHQPLWRQVLLALATSGREHSLLLEFVADDDPWKLLDDALTLRRWLDPPLGAGASGP